MKRISTLLISLAFLAIAVVLLVLTYRYRMPWEPVRISEISSSLVETSEASLLQTAEYSMNVLFPYDFIDDEDDPDWRHYSFFYDEAPEQYKLRSSASFYPSGELPEKWRYASLYKLCRDCGLDPAEQDFLVFDVRVRGGLPLNSEELELQFLLPDEKRVTLILPEPRITDIIIEDRISGTVGFPEVEMTPDQWSLFMEKIRPSVEELAIRRGLLRLAAETAEYLTRELFEGAGFELEEVVFQEN